MRVKDNFVNESYKIENYKLESYKLENYKLESYQPEKSFLKRNVHIEIPNTDLNMNAPEFSPHALMKKSQTLLNELNNSFFNFENSVDCLLENN
jgi:hypothetical protein